MRHRFILFIIFVVLLLPHPNFAQLGQTALQNDDACKAAKLHVQIKLKSGETIKGKALEINQDEVRFCRDGEVQTIPRGEIKELKDRQPTGLRIRRAARAVGLTFAGFIIFGILYSRQAP
jgi:hypothetical protein